MRVKTAFFESTCTQDVGQYRVDQLNRYRGSTGRHNSVNLFRWRQMVLPGTPGSLTGRMDLLRLSSR